MNYGNISDNNLHPCHFAFPPPALKRQSRGKASRIHPEKTARRQLQSHQRPPPVKQRLQHADRPYYYIHLWNLRHRDQVLSRLDLRRRKQRILDTEHLRQQIPTPQSDSSKPRTYPCIEIPLEGLWKHPVHINSGILKTGQSWHRCTLTSNILGSDSPNNQSVRNQSPL